MKNSFKVLTSIGIFTMLFLMSTTTAVAQKIIVAGNSGNVIQKNAQFVYDDEGVCNGTSQFYPETSSTVVIKANGQVKITIQTDLTGSCLVPTSGGAIQRDEPILDGNGNVLAIGKFTISPSGRATYKVTF